MPFYTWHGIDIVGQDHKGVLFARNEALLETVLFEQGIALLKAHTHSSLFKRTQKVSYATLADFSAEMANLLRADVPLDVSLSITNKTIHDVLMRAIVTDVVHGVQEGHTLSNAFAYHRAYIDNLLMFVIEAGQESGKLVEAFDALADYYQQRKELGEKLKTALLVPNVIFIFLCIIMLAIFTLVIPRFQSLFLLFNKTLPSTTQALFYLSTMMQRPHFWLTIALCIGIILVFIRLLHTERFRPLLDRIMLKLPIVGPLVSAYSLTLFLQTLGFLLRADVHLVKAIKIARNVLTNAALLSGVDAMIALIESGKSLSVSFKECLSSYKIIEDVESLFVVGEVTGQLASSVDRVASLYQQKTFHLLSRIARIVPMVLLIALGIFIALLMVALYLPLLSFAKLVD